MEDKRAIAPRLRVGRDKWFNLLWLIPVGFAPKTPKPPGKTQKIPTQTT